MFQLVGRNLQDEDYMRLVIFAFHKKENLEKFMKEVLFRQYIVAELERGDE